MSLALLLDNIYQLSIAPMQQVFNYSQGGTVQLSPLVLQRILLEEERAAARVAQANNAAK